MVHWLVALVLAVIPCALAAEARPVDHLNAKGRLLLRQSRRANPFGGGGGSKAMPGAFSSSSNADESGDSMIDSNLWTGGDGVQYQFRTMDNLEPVAPMDQIAPPGAEGGGEVTNQVTAGTKKALYVPPYMNADPFPVVMGSNCTCTLPANTSKDADCNCGNSSDHHSKWMTMEPGPSPGDYVLTPADITYASGNYWHPRIHPGGIVAPEDKLPPQYYPVLAPSDHFKPLPAVAREDRLMSKFARYVDQVEARSRECDGISENCTVLCKKGDKVNASIGNTLVNDAEILKTLVGNAMVLKFTTHEGKGNPKAVDCGAGAGCSVFRMCRKGDGGCVDHEDKSTYDWAGMLHQKVQCPAGTVPCKSVQQLVTARGAFKGKDPCRVPSA